MDRCRHRRLYQLRDLRYHISDVRIFLNRKIDLCDEHGPNVVVPDSDFDADGLGEAEVWPCHLLLRLNPIGSWYCICLVLTLKSHTYVCVPVIL